MHNPVTVLPTAFSSDFCTVVPCELCLDSVARLNVIVRGICPISEDPIEVRTFYCDECHSCVIRKLRV